MSSGKQHSHYGKSQRLGDLRYSLIYLPSFKTFCPKPIIIIRIYPTLLFIMLALQIPSETKIPHLNTVSNAFLKRYWTQIGSTKK
jgi:hypothetical protein